MLKTLNILRRDPLAGGGAWAMKHRSGWLAGAALIFSAMAADASEALRMCSQKAAECRAGGGSAQQCQAVVDSCMSDNACEEVYMSCLELMELEENLTEEACRQKRQQCVQGRAR